MFRADYAIASRDIEIGSAPLVATLAHRLIDDAAEVNLDKFSLLEGSGLFDKFKKAAGTRLEVQRLAIEVLGSVDSLEQADEGDRPRTVRAKAAVGIAEAAIGRFDAFAEAVTKATDGGYPPLVAAALRERLRDPGRAIRTSSSRRSRPRAAPAPGSTRSSKATPGASS